MFDWRLALLSMCELMHPSLLIPEMLLVQKRAKHLLGLGLLLTPTDIQFCLDVQTEFQELQHGLMASAMPRLAPLYPCSQEQLQCHANG